MSRYEELLGKIQEKNVEVAIIGMGYIGLPTALFYKMRGLRVTGIDTNRHLIENLKKGIIPIHEDGLEEIGKKCLPEINLVSTYDKLERFDIFVLCLPSPIDELGKPDITYLENTVKDIAHRGKTGCLFLVESTVPVGTNEKLSELFEKESGLKPDTDFWFAHCPERVLPGKVVEEMDTNHRLVGGTTPAATNLAVTFLRTIFQSDHVHPTSASVSEAAKLAENSFRDVNIAYANELAKICTTLSIDVTEVIELANLHPRVKILKPGLGVGGYCLPKDGWILVQSAKEKGGDAELIPAARSVNDSMPAHVARRIRKEVLATAKSATVGLLGLAFKENVSDTRNSPTMNLLQVLTSFDVDVIVYDPLVQENFGVRKAETIDELLQETDILVLCVGHTQILEELNSRDISGKVFVDPRSLLPMMKQKSRKYIGLSG